MSDNAKGFSLGVSWFEIALWKRILTAMVAGAILGSIWGPGAESIGWIGDLFIRLIRMIVVPLVFVTIVSGVVSMGDPSKLGSLGAKTLILYMLTTSYCDHNRDSSWRR
jgi:Na+/H+-dicarboxylate symporter